MKATMNDRSTYIQHLQVEALELAHIAKNRGAVDALARADAFLEAHQPTPAFLEALGRLEIDPGMLSPKAQVSIACAQDDMRQGISYSPALACGATRKVTYH